MPTADHAALVAAARAARASAGLPTPPIDPTIADRLAAIVPPPRSQR